jgi:hypothetical protein
MADCILCTSYYDFYTTQTNVTKDKIVLWIHFETSRWGAKSLPTAIKQVISIVPPIFGCVCLSEVFSKGCEPCLDCVIKLQDIFIYF